MFDSALNAMHVVVLRGEYFCNLRVHLKKPSVASPRIIIHVKNCAVSLGLLLVSDGVY